MQPDNDTLANFRKAFENIKPKASISSNRLTITPSVNAKPIVLSLTPKTLSSHGYNR